MGAIFAGPGDRVSSVATLNSNLIPDGTMMGWFRLASSGTVRRAFGWGNFFECRTDTSDNMLHEFFQSGTSLSFAMTVGTLVHFAFTWDQPSTTKRLYVDGVLNSQDTAATFSSNSIGVVTIGDRQTQGEGWDGYLDDMRLYTRELTAAEILTIFTMRNVQDGVSTDVLFRHWEMRADAEGTTVTRFGDLTGNQSLTVVAGTPTHADEAGIRYTRRAA